MYKSKFDTLFEQIIKECNDKLNITKQCILTGDNNISINGFNGNDVNVSDNNTDVDIPATLPIEEDEQSVEQKKYCKYCHGTGYIKSHSDQPDQKCPDCNGTDYEFDNIESVKDNEPTDNELSDAEIDAIIAKNKMKRLGMDDLYSESKKKK